VAKVLCVLYDIRQTGTDDLSARRCSRVEAVSNGQTLPSPEAIDFTPASFSGVSRVSSDWGVLEKAGHELVVTRQGRPGLGLRAGACDAES